MSFLSPGFLSALLLVAIPLIIHLIRRRKLKVIRWAAMDFLRQSQRKQKRRLRIEELILLALRILIVALAVLAFARPVLRALGLPLLDQNARVYAIFVLDNSFSMDFHHPDGKTSFARAQASADDILVNILKSGDSASLVLLSDKPEASVGAASFDLNLVRQRVRAAKVSDRATDYLAAAQTVVKLLKASKTPVKEVYWLTDDQAKAWESSKKESAHSVWQELGKLARVTWVSVGPTSGRDNLAVETPQLSRELVTPHLPLPIEVRVFNYGSKPRNDLLVNLFIDKETPRTKPVSVKEGGVGVVKFDWRFQKPKTYACRVELKDAQSADNLTRDNAASFVVRARDQIRVLVQDVHPTENPAKSESFYLMTAMAPGGEAATLAPRLREGEGLGNLNLRDYDAIVITGVTAMSAPDKRVLTEYVKAGGGLLLFPGPNTDASRLNQDLEEWLPAKMGTRKTLPEDQAITLNPATISHPTLALFKDTSSMNLGSARFTTFYPLEPVRTDDPNAVKVMAQFSDRSPAFVERKVGLGKVILAASSAGATWSQLPLKPSFVPLVYQLLSYLGQGPTAHRNLRQDETLSLSLPVADAGKQVRVTGPDGRTTAQNSVLDARGNIFTYAATTKAGLYRVKVEGSKTEDAFTVSLPPDESNLTSTAPAQAAIQAGLPAGNLVVAETPAQLQASVRRSRYGAEVWRPLIIYLVLPMLFLESLLAQRFGRRG